jgi:hypothetical protein
VAPKGGAKGGKGGSKRGLLQKSSDVSRISEMRLMNGHTRNGGTGNRQGTAKKAGRRLEGNREQGTNA